MTDFEWRHLQGDVILWAVRWYCRYPISYRHVEKMLAERGIVVDHTTIYRWVQQYAPEMEKRLRWFWPRGFDPSWRLYQCALRLTHAGDSQAAKNLIRRCRHMGACDGGGGKHSI
jgi:transposase-like protein